MWFAMMKLVGILIPLVAFASLVNGEHVYGSHTNQDIQQLDCTRNTEAKFGITYNGSTDINSKCFLSYNYRHEQDSVVYITTTLTGRDLEDFATFPTQVVIRQQLAIQSWNLPLEIEPGVRFTSVSRKLCATAQKVNTTTPISAEITTFSNTTIEFSVFAQVQTNLTVTIGTRYNIFITPTSPQYYQYTFDKTRDLRSVTLIISSEEDYFCARVSIQSAECPIEDLEDTLSTGVAFQTFLKSAAIIINKTATSDSVYIVFSVFPSDMSCANIDRVLPIGDPRMKNITFWIEDHVEDTVYIYATLASLGYCALYCICALLYLGIMRLWSRSKRAQEVEMTSSAEPPITGNLTDTTAAATSSGASNGGHIEDDDSLLLDTDVLEDLDEAKDVYRLKKHLMIADMARKSPAQLRKKYMLYIRTLISISIFYALPVAQLVLTYQIYLDVSGDQDTCYYNFLCSRKLGYLHSFNNVFSNIGYMVLGILFIVIIGFRSRDYSKLPEDQREKLGIPQHFGLFYAMGLALFVEGIMSGCYHVCPSYNNFQFDTAFMYILGGLLMLRLFQSRHADINANAHTAYLSLAVIIIIAVTGVLFNSAAFWYVFIVFYLLSVFYLSLQIYYVGQFRLNKALWQSLKLYFVSLRNNESRCKCSAPVYPVKFGFLLFQNACNWGLGLYGAITTPKDFASFMLYIMIINLFLYFLFYSVMKKFVHKEKIVPQTLIFGFLSLGLWVPALWYFTHNLTDWQKTPAKSRNLNAPCLILDFFDGHDIWHFFSAGAMFCSFLAILFIDDDLKDKPRTRIPVF